MERKQSLLQYAMTYGAFLGIVSVIIELLLYMVGFIPYNFARMLLVLLIGIIVNAIFVFNGTKSYRNRVLNGSIPYGRAVLVGMMIVVFSTIITSFYNLIFNLFIDPEYLGNVVEATKNWMFNFLDRIGASDADIEEAINKIEKKQANATPLKSFFGAISNSVLGGLIISLITSAFIKKNPNPFSEPTA